MPPCARGTPAGPGCPSKSHHPRCAVASTHSDRDAAALAMVAVGLDCRAPGPVFEIPADGLCDPGLEGVCRPPAELAADLARVDGVAAVVTRPVGHELLERVIPGGDAAGEDRVRRGWQLCLQRGTETVHHLEICPLPSAPDVVLLPHPPLLQHEQEPLAVVVHVEPVSHL